MAVFLDLEDENPAPDAATPTQGSLTASQLPHSQSSKNGVDEAEAAEERPNPNINGFSAALRRYP